MPRLTRETLRGVWAALPTSWTEDWQLDEPAIRENLRRLCGAGVSGCYITGTSGEFYGVAPAQFKELVRLLREETAAADIPMQVGCCGHATREVIALLELAAEAGANGAQVVLPFWMELTNAEIDRYFADLHAAVPDLPLVHYNIPRAKRFLVADDYRRLLDIAPNLIGVKFTQAGSNFLELTRAIRATPELNYFVGENLLATAAQFGARGSYSSLVCLNPRKMLDYWALCEGGQWIEALRVQIEIDGFLDELFRELRRLGLQTVDPAIDKGLAVASGFLCGNQRIAPPYLGWSNEGVAAIRKWLHAHYPAWACEGER